jgi:predicted kinase
VHINPDHFLETPNGRVTTPERNAEAWAKCYESLDAALEAASLTTRVFVLIGAQGSGKSTWARREHAETPDAIFFDAILVKRSERKPILDRARARGIPAVAVWFRTPIDVCLARNRARPADEVADEQGIRNVFAAIERPTIAEGFAEVEEILFR